MTLSVSASAPASCIDSPSQATDACVYPAPVCSDAENPCPPEKQRAPPALAPTVPWGLRFCREADTVVEGFLCDEPVVVSNACREPKNAVDAYVCDEPRMHALQDGIVRRTLSLLKSLLNQLMRD